MITSRAPCFPTLPDDIAPTIFSHMDDMTIIKGLFVNKKWNVQSNTILQEIIERRFIFGPDKWKLYFKTINDAPPLPEQFKHILKAGCKLVDGKISNLFILTLIPKGISLIKLSIIVESPKANGNPTRFSCCALENNDIINKKSYWALSSDILDESQGKSYEEQTKMVQSLNTVQEKVKLFFSSAFPCFSEKHPINNTLKNIAINYDLHFDAPEVVEIATSLCMHYIATGEYPMNKEKSTRCKDKVFEYPYVVGNYDKKGLEINSDFFTNQDSSINFNKPLNPGIAAVVRFY